MYRISTWETEVMRFTKIFVFRISIAVSVVGHNLMYVADTLNRGYASKSDVECFIVIKYFLLVLSYSPDPSLL